MYEFRPQRTNNKAQKLIILLFAGAAVLFLLTVPLDGLPFLWVIQLLALIMLVAAIFLVTRYVTKTYEYAVTSAEGDADLTVTEISSGGKRRITVCRISLSGIVSVRCVDSSDERFRAQRRSGGKIYDYRPDLSPERSVLIEAKEGGEELRILLAYGEDFFDILERNINGRNI